MADPDRDARVSERYRALGREEPPPALDSAILAASRRRPLRWAVPVSVAAVVVLAVGVTLRVQLEEPQRPEEVALAPKVMDAPASAPPAAAAESRARADSPARQSVLSKREALAEAAADRAEPAAPASSNVVAGRISAAAPETPGQWLERIAKLREAGRAREADESLAEFRKRYPDYRIPEKMRARVAPR
jgi:hypothetical protein